MALLGGCAGVCEPLATVPISGQPLTAVELVSDAVAQFGAWASARVCVVEVQVGVRLDEDFGEYLPGRRLARVFVSPGQREAETVNTVWHELCHAADEGLSDAQGPLFLGAGIALGLEADSYENMAFVCAYGPEVLAVLEARAQCEGEVFPLGEAARLIRDTIYDRYHEPALSCEVL